MKNLQIRDVKAILTAPEGINLVVVKVETNEPGLYGLGCATFTQRYLAVATAIEDYMKPFLIGKDPRRIEDIWQTAMVSAYWRNGPVLNNAVSGVDMALWDIKGKLAGMPVYDLFGGRSREAVALYRHADGRDLQEIEHNIGALKEQGYKYIRCQWGLYGGKQTSMHTPEQPLKGAYYDPDAYARSIPVLFEHVRSVFGYDLELIHDAHERVAPIEAIRLAKQLEPYRLFFLEDPLAPEDLDWFRRLRNYTTPIAMGELFVHPQEWLPLVRNQLIDFIRVHISAIGGLTPARKLAVLCESFGVRTAWHGPGDVSPVGHAANLHLDMSAYNFGVQEWYAVTDRSQEVFPGCPEVRNGFACLSDKPGLGVDIDEKAAAKYPCVNILPEWTLARKPDGTSARP